MKKNGTKKSGNGFEGFINSLAENFLSAKAAKKNAEIDYSAAKTAIVQVLAGALTAETSQYAIVYANNTKETVDIERLKAEEPDLYRRFLRKTDCFVLTVHQKAAVKVA